METWLQEHWGGIGVGLTIVLEIALRIWKSDKIRSIFRIIAFVCTKLAEVLDKAVPDRTP